jgi:vancomycin resistance protein YoaR
VAARNLNGVVIPPGYDFSFLREIGPITKAAGYLESLIIKGDATVPGIGGGVCQVSTTVFRAAFWAGLPIVERNQHSYRVSYYEQDGTPPGLDAAVYDPGVNLRFRNDTGHPVLLQSAVDPVSGTLIYRVYGTRTGRQVRLEEVDISNRQEPEKPLPDVPDPSLPLGERKQVEWAAEGMQVTVTRAIFEADSPTTMDTFVSKFVPWREKWLIGAEPTPTPTDASPGTAATATPPSGQAQPVVTATPPLPTPVTVAPTPAR